MGHTKESAKLQRQKFVEKLRQPEDTDEQAEARYRQYMSDMGKKVKVETRQKAAETKMKQDPKYFQKLVNKRWDNRD